MISTTNAFYLVNADLNAKKVLPKKLSLGRLFGLQCNAFWHLNYFIRNSILQRLIIILLSFVLIFKTPQGTIQPHISIIAIACMVFSIPIGISGLQILFDKVEYKRKGLELLEKQIIRKSIASQGNTCKIYGR